MDKQMFIEEMIEQVRRLPISSILSTRMELIKKGRHLKGLCPFHADTRLGSFIVTDSKGIFKCFSCGVGGDGIKFIAELEGKNYLESAFEIALQFGIITLSEYEEYYNRKRYKENFIKKIEKKYEAIDKNKFENNIADEDTLDKVFSIFIEVSGLSEKHKNYLMETRGLNEEEIKEGKYFTFPTRHKMSAIARKVREDFGSEDVLKRIPGFFFNKETNLYSFAKNKGIGIGIQNAEGKIVGIQIRRDDCISKDQRYIWFSSSFAIDDEKYIHGTSSGAPIDVVYPKKITNRTVFITEGRFKAQCLAKETGSIVLSVQGISSWRGILKELKKIPYAPKTKERYHGNFYIYSIFVAFDSDQSYNYQVFEQLKNMTDQLEKHSYAIYYLYWDSEKGKGIDDCILNGYKHLIKRYDKKVWDKKYEEMVQILLKEEGYSNIRKVPKELIKKYFDDYMQIPALKKNEKSLEHQKILKNRKGA